ncbi:mannitol dehydrogenase family protein [Herbiconiux sp. UC225_62]|uniref:mannitol dehydrogenase family protein n=1 Tax=Herbiconiux sp. UC225_62 TaxID=3350168 RepID=UPI0036D33D79
MTAVELDASTVDSLPPAVARPRYDRTQLGHGIVHIGVGGFHRAHEAAFVDRLLDDPAQRSWGIVGIGLLASDAAMRDALGAQDGLYTLVTRAPDGESEARVIGSLADYVFAPDDAARALEALTDRATKIVSLTITEGGYLLDPATGRFDARDPGVVADLERGDEPPRTVFGLLTEALRGRRSSGIPPFTVMSCDNIEGNGDVARQALVAYAGLEDAGLAAWIEQNCAFPNSMVDRITPATTPEGRAWVADRFGIDDRWPVISESFVQWVLEDDFTAGRPPFELAGVQLVDDVRPYEMMKLRLLNASHQAMSYLGILAGHEFVHDVVTDDDYAGFLLGYMTEEATPTLAPVPGIDLEAYRLELLARFSNPAIADTLARQVVDGSERIAKFLLPVARERVELDQSVDHIALILAAWGEYIRVISDRDGVSALNDVRAEELAALAASESADGAELLTLPVFGALGRSPILVDAYRRARRRLLSEGPREAMRRLRRNHR